MYRYEEKYLEETKIKRNTHQKKQGVA